MAYITHDGQKIGEPSGQVAPSPWETWLQRQKTQGVAGLPEQIQAVHREHGLDPSQACKGCLSLRKYTKMRTHEDHYQCTRWGGDAEWKPDWPACGERSTPEKKGSQTARRPRGRQAA